MLLTMFLFSIAGETVMKGRTICPKCNHDFILDIPINKEKHKTICPKCKHKFTIKKSDECNDSKDECIWEEHGEPRKTILSSIKPRTDKPMIASLLLSIVFIFNIITVIFIQIKPEFFLNRTFGLFSNISIDIDNNLIIFSIIFILFSVFALIASILSYRRNRLKIVMICSFISIFSMGLFFIGSLLSLFALILIFYSKEEFIDEKKGKIF